MNETQRAWGLLMQGVTLGLVLAWLVVLAFPLRAQGSKPPHPATVEGVPWHAHAWDDTLAAALVAAEKCNGDAWVELPAGTVEGWEVIVRCDLPEKNRRSR